MCFIFYVTSCFPKKKVFKKMERTKAPLLFGKFDFLQVVFSVNVDLSDVAPESEQGPDRGRRSFKQRTNWGSLEGESAEPDKRLQNF